MSDIVHWLRKLAALVEADHAPQHVVMHMRAGADEIERLRAENERLREWNREIALNARELVAENERLRAALSNIRHKRREMEMGDLSAEEAVLEVDAIACAVLEGKHE